MILKTSGRSGITMLSGVAEDGEAEELARKFSDGELVRIMGMLQTTVSGFTRSSSRRLDAELCILTLCQPALSLDPESLNARLTRLEDQIKTGQLPVAVVSVQSQPQKEPAAAAPLPEQDVSVLQEDPVDEKGEEPVGFWADLVAAVRKELKPPAFGFFSSAPNAPIQCALHGQQLSLLCANSFILEMINKREIIDLVSLKAAVLLGRPVAVKVVDRSGKHVNNNQMEKLLDFGREHPDIVNIKK
jgi:hypothetical protein